MRKLIVNRSEAKVILEQDQFTFVRRVFARGCSAIEAAEKAFSVGARYWVAEPICYVAHPIEPESRCKKWFSADGVPDGHHKITLDRPGYRVDRCESRHVVEVVSIGKSINQQKWAAVAHVDVTFRKVVK